MTWDDAVAFALTLPGTELGSSYDRPAVKATASGRSFLSTGHEPDTSFVLAIDRGTIELLKETDPATFWQTSHYEGWDAVLVRYDSAEDERVRETIERARDWVAAKPKARLRKRK